MFFKKKEKEILKTELNQHVKPVSLTMDAWKRLFRNRMAVIGLGIVAFYVAVSLLLPLFGLISSYETQVIDHRSLPPSTRAAGELMLETRMIYTKKLMAAQGRTDLTEQEKAEYAKLEASVQSDPIHQRHYWLGTDSRGRDLLARVI